MPTAFPRAIVYDPARECHLTVVVRRDLSYFSYFCADHNSEDRFPLDSLERFREIVKRSECMQVCSWLEVHDDGL